MAGEPKSRVLLLRTALPVRLQLRRLLRESPGLEVVGQALGSEPLAALVRQTGANRLLADVRDGSQDALRNLTQDLAASPGIEAAVALVAEGPAPAVDGTRSRLSLLAAPADLEAERPDGAFATSLRALLGAGPAPAGPILAGTSRVAPAPLSTRNPAYDCLAIGASTGGPQALLHLMSDLRGRLNVPLLITQHLSDGFTQALAMRLGEASGIPTVVAQEGLALRAGHAVLAPAGRHLAIVREGVVDRCRLDDGPPEHFCKPAVDVMLRSLADGAARRCLVVILTGMGQDGLRGCEALAARGATVLAQDQSSSVVWGMPGSVARAGLARRVLPLDQLGAAVLAELGAEA